MTQTEKALMDANVNPDCPAPDAGASDAVSSQLDDEFEDAEREDKKHPHEESADEKSADNKAARRRVSVSLRGLVHSAIIVALVATIGVLAWLYWQAQQKIDTQAQQSANYAHAQKIALDYATNAAAMDYQKLDEWKAKLVAGTTPELKDKLTKAATSMEQIVVPLQWSSTATSLAAKTRSNTGTIYVVDAFVSVQTKTVQAPDPLQSTAAYSVTIDSSKGWQISDVGGIGAVIEGR
jgi:flagellar basal body-associated protein FliL